MYEEEVLSNTKIEKVPISTKGVGLSRRSSYGSNDNCSSPVSSQSRTFSSNRNICNVSEDIENGVKFVTRQRFRSMRKPSRHRLVEKNGKRNVRTKDVPRNLYFQDIFTTIIDGRWKWTVLLFLLFYLGSWLFFAIVWYLLLLTQGEKCFTNVENFTETFLLSLETSMTIGYGGRLVSSKCTSGVIILILQCLVSSAIEACIMGLVFTKIARPGKRQTTVIFSKNAVITKRDDKFCLMFNVADIRKRQLEECFIRLHLFRTYKTLEGKIIPNHQNQLRTGMDWYNIRDDSDRLFLLFPSTITHVIDRKSPFYNISREMYMRSDWELVVVLEGTVEATGCTMQARTSYLPHEVYWGKDFVDIAGPEDWVPEHGILYVLNKINQTQPVSFMPTCSPRDYYKSINKDPDPDHVYEEQDELWEDQNFTEVGEKNRVLPTHESLTEREENNVFDL